MKPPLPLLFSGSVGKDASAEEEAVNLQLLDLLLEALVRRRVGEDELRKTRVRALAVYGEQHVVSARRHAWRKGIKAVDPHATHDAVTLDDAADDDAFGRRIRAGQKNWVEAPA